MLLKNKYTIVNKILGKYIEQLFKKNNHVYLTQACMYI